MADGFVYLQAELGAFEDDVALSTAAELGRPAGVIQLLDRHDRDCDQIAQRLEIPRLKVPTAVPDSPFAVIPVVSRPWWREVALWWESERTLVVAEAVGSVPAFALGRRLGMHPMLRLTPPRGALQREAPDRLLVGHGPTIESGAESAIRDALSAARSDILKFVLTIPSLIRGR